MRTLLLVLALVLAVPASAQNWLGGDNGTNQSIFRPLDWPAANSYRTGAGTPGPEYWQQRADYVIEARLDTTDHTIHGSERITYHNNSPSDLPFLWVQLDQNVRSREHSRTYQLESAIPADLSPQARQFLELDNFDGGYDLTRVEIVQGRNTVPADYRVDDTIMKINLPTPVKSGETVSFDIDWSYRIPDDGRGAKEMVEDGYLYEMAQWFPRMSVYDDVQGWQTDQFLGQGEFYLNFGNYDVKLTVPWNHIVEATGVLQNDREVLTSEQRSRLARAYQSEEPVFIIAADEVMTPASRPTSSGMQTWHYKAENVRDFAWVSSKTYVWDAAGYTYPGTTTPIVVHSLYPRDAMPLWDKVSTRATIQTLKTYGEMSFPYPYPKAANVHGPVFGMEYPMISFCGARPDAEGNYSEGLERALIGVTIHEVGHNWFPMIVASDERQHTWMDEGLNSFLEYYGRHDYARTYCGKEWTQTDDCVWPASRGDASQIIGYMRDDDQVPIMAESDVVHRGFGSNAYGKPATGLVMLREKILGPTRFDEAFRFYSTQWMFKHPQPADFFRSMEEGSGENLDWFWRGWFYTTNANDQTLAQVSQQDASELTDDASRGANYYRVQVDNSGGIVMPIELEFRYADGTMDRRVVPADVWRNNEKTHTVGMFSDKQLSVVVLDPDEAYADINRADNLWIAPTMTDAEVEAMGLMRPLTPEQAMEYAGSFMGVERPLPMEFTVDGSVVSITINGQGPFGLTRGDTDDAFVWGEAEALIVFTRDASGAVTGLTFSGPADFTANRVEAN